MINRITYKDILGATTSIIWFRRDEIVIGDEYFDRVVADGGTLEAEQCVSDRLQQLIGGDVDYYDFCGTDNPLRLRWHGDDYDGLRASEASINVMVRSDADSKQLRDLLGGGYYMHVYKDGNLYWIGKLNSQFFVETYAPYPYPLELTASDQLGEMKQYQALMTDFPEPWPNGRKSLLDIFNQLLTDIDIKPPSTLLTSPDRLNIGARLYHVTTPYLETFENTFADPLCFMETDKDEYISKWKMLNAILEPMHMRLYQWLGEWWLLSIDQQWDNAKLDYRKYRIDDSGWTYLETVYGDYSEVIDICDDTDQTWQLKDRATLEYLPAWQGVNLVSNFEQNLSILPVYANRTGSNYKGDSQTFLEFGVTTGGTQTQFRYWTMFNYMSVKEYAENEGWIELTPYNTDTGRYYYNTVDLTKKQNITTFSIAAKSLIINLNETDQSENRIKLMVRLEGASGFIYHAWDDGGSYRWDQFETRTLEFAANEDVTFTLGLPDNILVTGDPLQELLVRIYDGVTDKVYSDKKFLLRGLNVGVSNDNWNAIEYQLNSLGYFTPININPEGELPPQDFDFRWGLWHPSLPNDHDFHLSSPYYADGEPINNAWKRYGEEPDTKAILDWLYFNYRDDKLTVTPYLKVGFRSNQLTPMTIVKDIENRYYRFVNGELNDKWQAWHNEYAQFKGIRNTPTEVGTKGSFAWGFLEEGEPNLRGSFNESFNIITNP